MTSDHPRRAVLYGRVSQARRETKSVADQLAELRAWARRDGWIVVAEYRDEGISASRYAHGKARPGWQQVIDTITANSVDTLAVWEISRASRDRAVFAALLAQCVEAGVMIATGGRLHDPADADDGFLLDLGGALAVRESNSTSKRTKRAAQARAEIGKPHSALPFGYRRVCNSETGATLRWELHPEHAAVVAEIVRRLLAGEPAEAVAKDLNQRKVPTMRGKLWHGGALSKMALRPAYAGFRVRAGQVLDGVPAQWPAVISEDEHYRLTALYAEAERDKWRTPKHQKHLGTGLFRCGRDGCHGRMRVVVHVGKSNRYDCRECHKVSRLQGPVDEWVVMVLIARLSRPDVLDLLTATDDDEPARRAAAEVTRLRAKLTHARLLVDQDKLSLESLADLEARTLPRIREAQRRVRPRPLPDAVMEAVGGDAESVWDAASIVDRREVLDALAVVTILPTERRFQPFDPDTVQIAWRQY